MLCLLYFILVFLIELLLVSPDVADKVFPWNLRTVKGYLKISIYLCSFGFNRLWYIFWYLKELYDKI